jgi:hypothetical protein
MAELPGGAAIDPGKHHIQIAKGIGPALIDDAVDLGPGERLDVEGLEARTQGAWEIAPRFAVMSFLDNRSRNDVLGPVFGAGATLVARDWPSHRLNLRVDAVGTTGSGSLSASTPVGPTAAAYGYTAVTAGVALPWRFSLTESEGLQLLLGPRLSMIYLSKAYQLDLMPSQSYLTLTPGLLTGISWQFGKFTLGAEAQVDFMLVRIDGQNRSTGFGEFLLGGGYRF